MYIHTELSPATKRRIWRERVRQAEKLRLYEEREKAKGPPER